MTQSTDWVVATVIFMGGITFMFLNIGALVTERPDPQVFSQIEDAIDSVTTDTQVRTLMLESGCNTNRYDCNFYYPTAIDFNTARFAAYSGSMAVDGNLVIVRAKFFEPQTLYSMDANSLTRDTNTADWDLSASSIAGGFRVQNAYLSADVISNRIAANFAQTTQTDLQLDFNDFTPSLVRNAPTLVKLQDTDTNLTVYFFPHTPAFWVLVASSTDVNIGVKERNWQLDTNIGTMGTENWWDYNTADGNTWTYRLPLTVRSQSASGTNLIVKRDVNMEDVFNNLGLFGTSPHADSFRIVEYNDENYIDGGGSAGNDPNPFRFNYDDTNKMVTVFWRLDNNTDANTVRSYQLYFDTSNNGTASTTAMTYTLLEPPIDITQGQAETQNQIRSGSAKDLLLFNPDTLIVAARNRSDGWNPALVADANAAYHNCTFSHDANITLNCPQRTLLTFSFRPTDINDTYTPYPLVLESPRTALRLTTNPLVTSYTSAILRARFENNQRSFQNAAVPSYDVLVSRRQPTTLLKTDGNVETGNLIIQIPKKGG